MAKLAERITVDPEQCGGRPCIRGMRIRVTDVLDLLANGRLPQSGFVRQEDIPLPVFLENRFGQVYAKPESATPRQRVGGGERP